jgi:hypothetical protein
MERTEITQKMTIKFKWRDCYLKSYFNLACQR